MTFLYATLCKHYLIPTLPPCIRVVGLPGRRRSRILRAEKYDQHPVREVRGVTGDGRDKGCIQCEVRGKDSSNMMSMRDKARAFEGEKGSKDSVFSFIDIPVLISSNQYKV